MRVVVTGASGRIGQVVVRELAAHDHEVIANDVKAPPEPFAGRVAFVQGDVTDYGDVLGMLGYRGKTAEAVLHLAAIPSPTAHPPEVVYRTNVLGVYNVTEGCAALGIGKLIETSSINWLGMDFPYHPYWPDYLPVDEQHPNQAQDPYALSKYVGEQAAITLRNRTGADVASIRPPYVVFESVWPDVVRRVREKPLSFASGLWAYVDVRDLAVAYRLALETTFEKHEPFYIVADDAVAERPVAELAPQVDADLGAKAVGLTGTQPGVSNAKARAMLGWQPQYSWRQFADGAS